VPPFQPPFQPSPSHDAGASATLRGPGPAASHAARTAGPQAGAAGGVGTLLEAAGIDPATVDERTLAALGEILHVVVDGLMDVLRARAAIKNQFRVPMTTLKAVENNPLKFSASAGDALFNLFGRRNTSFVEPVEAFREAFDDLKAHQMAMMAGMRAAFTALLRRFDPDRLQEGFDKGLKRATILDVINKTKYWDLYREMHEEFGDDDATFRHLFGDDFAQAYEEQMQRLTASRRRQ
jgi:type VI secretion system FHA domain protein